MDADYVNRIPLHARRYQQIMTLFPGVSNFGNLETVEPEFKRAARLVQELDRQGRGVMVAGGRALMDQGTSLLLTPTGHFIIGKLLVAMYNHR